MTRYFLVYVYPDFLLPCPYWRESQHILFQLANGCFLLSSLAIDTKKGILFLHAFFIAGFFLYSTWSWNIICAPDVFSWTFGFTLLNMAQVIHGVYILRPVKIDPELEPIFKSLFEPLGVDRKAFKKFVSPEYAQICTLQPGDAYAVQNLTRSGRLALLLCGKVTVLANTVSRYITWTRPSMDYLFAKEPQVATALSILVARDVTTKLSAMNEKISIEKGYRVDIRLQCTSFSPIAKAAGKIGSCYDSFSSPKTPEFKVKSSYSFMKNGNIMLDEPSF